MKRHLANAASRRPCKRFASSAASAELPQKADCVVIGGGVMGAGCLYHLAKKGFTSPVLLEKGTLTCGSTWHAAGLCTYWNGGSNMRKVHHFGCELYKTLQEETGVDVGFQTPGSIRLIENDPDRIDDTHREMGKSRLFDAKQELITPSEIQALHPLVNTEGIWGGIYTTGDGHIDPTGTTNALVKGAKNRGAKVFQDTAVEKLELQSDGRWIVHTKKGTITADRIINAAGLWGDAVASMAGVHHPLAVIEHQYVITKTIPEVQEFWKAKGHQLPVLRSLSGSYYVRQERDGLLVGPYEGRLGTDMEMHDEWNRKPFGQMSPMDFGHDLFPEDLDRLMPHMEHVSELIPQFASAEINSVVNGPVSWPPDGAPLMGPVNDVPNYWAACGCSYGIAQSAGLTDYLTDWIITGEPPMEMFEADPTRYGSWAGKNYSDLKVRETYSMNNHIVFPNEERHAGRPIRANALYPILKQKGCQFGFHNGLETPLWFADPNDPEPYKPSWRRTNWHEPVGQECKTVIESCGVMDASSFSKYLLFGPNAANFLDRIQANKLPAVGKVSLGHMLTEKGKIMAELTISRVSEDTFYICTGSDMERHDMRWIQMNEMPADCELTNLTQAYGVLAIAGPNSSKILSKISDIIDQDYETDPLSTDKVKFFSLLDAEIGGCPVMLLRLSYTGLEGWEIHCQQEYLYTVYNAIHNAGKQLGVEVGDFGAYAMNSFRLEAGFKGLGSDMRKDCPALSCGIKKFVKTKGRDFIGRKAILEERKNPWTHKIVKVEVDTDDADALGDNPIYATTDCDKNKPIGWTSSGGWSWVTNRSLSFAFVPPDRAVPGEEVFVDVLGQYRKAKVLGEAL